MTRYVVNNNEVPHLWAHQTQAYARGNGSISFEGKTLYSYSTPIARIVEASDGATVYLITNTRYSPTTSKHLTYAERAIPPGFLRFVVPNLGMFGGHKIEQTHEENVKHLVKEYEERVKHISRKLSLYQPVSRGYWEVDILASNLDNIHEYCKVFNITVPSNIPATIDADLEKINVVIVKRNTPEKIAKRQAEAKAREEKQRIYEAEQKILNADKIDRWQKGEDVYINWFSCAYLRVKDDVLETSQGVRVPLDHAIRAFKFIRQAHDTATSWERNGHSIRVGEFQIDSIDTEGNFHAGCHYIEWAEVERIAKSLGLFE